MFIQPELLKTEAQRVSTSVFLCGPGYNSSGIEIRKKVKKHLESVPRVKVVYGEEVEDDPTLRRRKTDLQTLETFLAHDVDFTLLILESPGAIAELGAFSMMRNIRSRLFVLVPKAFYRAESYIARGPLSVLAEKNPNSVIYYDPSNPNEIAARVKYPITFFKYAHYTRRSEYLRHAMWSNRMLDKEKSSYEDYMADITREYLTAIALISVMAIGKPNYSELLLISGFGPSQLNTGLHELLKAGKIAKSGSGLYETITGWDDEILASFNSTEVSRARAKLLATA